MKKIYHWGMLAFLCTVLLLASACSSSSETVESSPGLPGMTSTIGNRGISQTIAE